MKSIPIQDRGHFISSRTHVEVFLHQKCVHAFFHSGNVLDTECPLIGIDKVIKNVNPKYEKPY
jgi:hypothetical protein